MNTLGPIDTQQALSPLANYHATKLEESAQSAKGSSGPEAAEAFEKLFSTMLVRELRKSMPEGFFSGSGSDVYGGWFDEEIGKTLAQQDALGFARMIRADLARTSAVDESPSDTETR